MAVTATVDEVKVVVKFVKGSQTIGHCNKAATDEGLYELGHAIGSLNLEDINEIIKVTESKLLKEA